LDIKPLETKSLDTPPPSTSRSTHPPTPGEQTSSPSSSARVTLSGASQKLQGLQDGSSDINAERLAIIAAAIAASDIPADTKRLADNIIATTLEVLKVGNSVERIQSLEASLLDHLNQEILALKAVKATVEMEGHAHTKYSNNPPRLKAVYDLTTNALAQLDKIVAQRNALLDQLNLPPGCGGVRQAIEHAPQLTEVWLRRQAIAQEVVDISNRNIESYKAMYTAQGRPLPQCDGRRAAS